MNTIYYFIITAIVFFASCNKNEGVTPDPVRVDNIPGTYHQTIKTSDQKDREFIIYVPESASGKQDVPVVFFLHGTGSNGQLFHDNPDLWIPKADKEGFIVVHPTALIHCHFDKGAQKITTKWSHGDLGESNTALGGLPLCENEKLAKDVEFFDVMIDLLKKDYSIDDKRIYLSGNSNGAGMGLRLAAERSDVFVAVAVNAGFQSLFLDRSKTVRPMSIMITVGTNDHLFAEAIGSSTPIPISESLLPKISNNVQAMLDVHALGDTSKYMYSEKLYGSRNTGEFHFKSPIMGNNNELKLIIVEGFGHGYNPALVNVFWDFFKTKSLPQ